MMPLFVIVSFIPQRPQKPQKYPLTLPLPWNLWLLLSRFGENLEKEMFCWASLSCKIVAEVKPALGISHLRKAFSIYHCINQKPQQNMDNWISCSPIFIGLRNGYGLWCNVKVDLKFMFQFFQLCLWNVNSHAYKVWTLLLKLWFLLHF